MVDAPPSAAAAAATEELAAQLAKLDAERSCVVCMDAPRCVLLMPCRHLALCDAPECAAMLGAPPRCPVCREAVAHTISVYT
jgi:hypothetical protein